jgi:arabinose-5-phosphate isomerase
MSESIRRAKEVISLEAAAVAALADKLTDSFTAAVNCIYQSKGRVVVCGVGKSGHIGKKIAATLASTGTPSFFVHPSEAIHGDLGMIRKDDIFLSLSKSGETDEVLRVIPYIKYHQIPHITLVGNIQSTLARHADFVLDTSVEQEACLLQLAPTTSTTATLVMGDALAMALMQVRNFQPEDFAIFHPGGTLGRKLLTKVADEMRTEVPTVLPTANLKEVVIRIGEGKMGLVVVTDALGTIKGLITDGDLRRAIAHYTDAEFFTLQAQQIMKKHPLTVPKNMSITVAEEIMNEYSINALLVVENEKLIGILPRLKPIQRQTNQHGTVIF